MRVTALLCLGIAASLAGCGPAPPSGPAAVSFVGDAAVADPTRAGLVRLDRTGQVVPALALRWAILEDGRDYLFRIDDAPGRPSAVAIARGLRRVLGQRRPRREALPVEFASVAAVTPTVIEIRLVVPQPDFLQLLAQPPFDLPGAGPFAAAAAIGGAVTLRPRGGTSAQPVQLRREQVGRAVARLRADASALVTGGSFADLPVVRAAGVDPRLLHFDPATGLFGFALAEGSRFADPALLHALDLALDRRRIVADFGAPGSGASEVLSNGGGPPSAAQLADAIGLVGRTRLPPLRVAIPHGPGGRLLFARAAQDWRRIGVEAVAVPLDADADLVLIDRVAPPGAVAALACAVSAGCDSRSPAAWGQASFLAIGNPIRWSLVARGLDGFQANALAAHPLDQLHASR